MNDKLKEIIAIAMEADEKILYKFFPGDGDGYLSIYDWDASGDNLHIQYKTTSLTSYRWEIFSLSDLLFNHEFMRALLGNGCTNFKDVICTEDRVCTFSESCETCEYYSPINAMLKAAQLPTDQQRIDYVHGLIKGESE